MAEVTENSFLLEKSLERSLRFVPERCFGREMFLKSRFVCQSWAIAASFFCDWPSTQRVTSLPPPCVFSRGELA